MSILTEPLPTFISAGGQEYPVRTDFRVWIRFSEIMADRESDIYTKLTRAVMLCIIPEGCPALPAPEELLKALCGFFTGEELPEKQMRPGGGRGKRVFSFGEDADYIYAAFYQQYGIDLTKESLHWHQFSALLKGLSAEVRLMKIVAWRSADLSAVSDGKKREYYRKMKELYALPDDRTEQEKEAALADTLSQLV